MKYNFCTLFDSYYLTRGLTLYYSLEATCETFHIYIYSFDSTSNQILNSLHLKNATIISLSDFETSDLLSVKSSRTIAEYCWTCTASTIWHSIKRFKLDHCVYLDADMYFFSSPKPIFDEIGENSVGITAHNFSPKLKTSVVYGKYCVQFVYFKNNPSGLEVLDWWRKSCIDWCYARMEDGKYGDQKYLDYFSEKFASVHEITHLGAGVAPWNIDNFAVLNDNGILKILPKNRQFGLQTIIFYHFQGLKFECRENKVMAEASFLKIDKQSLQYLYEPYIKNLIKVKNSTLDSNDIFEPIFFYRKYKNIFGQVFKSFFKQFEFIQRVYFILKKKRYSQPKGIGANININSEFTGK